MEINEEQYDVENAEAKNASLSKWTRDVLYLNYIENTKAFGKVHEEHMSKSWSTGKGYTKICNLYWE